MNDPKREYCKCGYSFIPSTYMKLIMLIRGRYVLTCPHCQSKLSLKMVHYVIVDKRDNVRDERIWERA